MDDEEFFDENLEVLQNIEATVVHLYHTNPSLTDFEVMQAYEALMRNYQRESTGKEPVIPRGEASRKVYEQVREICEWRLGRSDIYDDKGKAVETGFTPLQPSEMVQCFKRLLKSARMWNKDAGRQGYLNYIEGFLP